MVMMMMVVVVVVGDGWKNEMMSIAKQSTLSNKKTRKQESSAKRSTFPAEFFAFHKTFLIAITKKKPLPLQRTRRRY